VAGWFIDAQGRAARTVRVRLGDRLIAAAGVPRPDALAAARRAGLPATSRPPEFGFYAAFTTRPGWKFLRIEADDEDGRVVPIGTRLLYVCRSGRHRNNYLDWVLFYDDPGGDDYAAMLRRIEAWPHLPRISILLVAGKTPTANLRKAIEAVRTQIYPQWDLLVLATGTGAAALEDFPRLDSRIRILPAASAVESETARHDFIVWLEAAGTLRRHALFLLVAALQTHPDAAFLYGDDDEIGREGKRQNPDFKPDWNPALLLGRNYLGHVVAFHPELLGQLADLWNCPVTASLWEIALQLTSGLPAARIVHLPHILFHRNPATASGMPGPGNPAQMVERHLRSRGILATVESVQGRLRIKYVLPQPAPKVSLVIPSACRLQFLEPCIKDLLERTRYSNFEIILAVNAIRDEVLAQRDYLTNIAHDPRVRVLRYPDQPFNIAWVLNWAEKHAAGSILGFLNDDLGVIHEDWLEQMVATVLQEGVGLTSPILYYPTGQIQHAGVILGVGGLAEHSYREEPLGTSGYFDRAVLSQDLSCVTGACIVVRRSVFAQVGGFRELLKVDYNDVDLCLRVRQAGWRILWMPSVELIHHESVSIGTDASSDRAKSRSFETTWMLENWSAQLISDPFYNPNLSLIRGLEWQPAFPPRVRRPWKFELDT